MINKISHFYEYLFYKFYTWDIWLNRGKDPFPQQAGWFLLSLWVGFNFLTILMVLELFTGFGYHNVYKSKMYIVIINVFSLLLNYFIFIYKKKYKNIIKKFQHESRELSLKGDIIALIYVFFSLASPFCFGYLLSIYRPVLNIH